MKNKIVKLLFGIVLLVVLTGGYFGVKSYVASQEEQETEQEEEKTSVFDTETDKIQSLKFLIDEKEVTFKKDGEVWVKEDEEDFPVDQDVMNSAASSISSVDAERVLEKVDNLGEYELDNPENTITIFSGEVDEETTVIRVGMKNESTNQCYVSRNDDRSTVYVVDAASIDPFMNSLYDYAKMQTFPGIDSSTVSRVNVKQKEKSYEAVKDENTGLWTVESDGKTEKGDSSKFSSLATSLGSLEFDSFVDYQCSDKGKYGLEEPYAVVTVDYEEEVVTEGEDADTEDSSGTDSAEEAESKEEYSADEDSGDSDSEEEIKLEQKELVFMVGNETESDSRYVMIQGSQEVYTMTNELLSTVIDKDVSAMWDMTVNYVSLNDLDSLSVKLDGEEKEINVSRETLEKEEISKDTDENSEEKIEYSGDELSEESDNEPDEPEKKLEEGTEDGSDTELSGKTEAETVVTYVADGKTLDDIKFSIFYNKLNSIIGQKRLIEEYYPEDEPEMSVVFHKSTDGESVNVDFYEYDVNYYAAVVDKKVYLFNKMTFRELREAYESLFLEEDTE